MGHLETNAGVDWNPDTSEHLGAANNFKSDKSMENLSSQSMLADPAAPLQPIANVKIITLDVGGRLFKVFRNTLTTESGLFRLLFSDRSKWDLEPDGSYFLDQDPDLFAHLLRFMRRPSIFPLFYKKDSGFDYDLYNRLEMEAEYFQMNALHDWIKAKKYLGAIVMNTYAPESMELDEFSSRVTSINQTEDRHVMPMRTRKVYICPRGIYVHRGDPTRCGQACHRAQGDNPRIYEDENVMEVVRVKKEIEFVAGVCRL